MTVRRKRRYGVVGGVGAGLITLGLLSPSGASSHREAPMITEDPTADNTDVYAFVSPDRPDTVTVVADWIPLEEPGGGPYYYRFSDDALYEIHMDTNGDSFDDVTFQFRFRTTFRNPDTALYNTGPVTSLDDPDLNLVQTYSVTKLYNGVQYDLAKELVVPPVNIGPRSTPDYEKNLGSKGVYDVGYGERVFAGQRDDPFFIDVAAGFDLLGLRPFNEAHKIPKPTAPGVDQLAKYNVHSIAVQVPISVLMPDPNADPVVGVWASTSRRQTRVYRDDGAAAAYSGKWVQVSRLGMPLVNELVIPTKLKDRFNSSKPNDDAQFGSFVLDPEPARLIPALYPGVMVPPAPRNDLVAVYLTGIPGLNKPASGVPSEMIRLNMSIPPTDPAKASRLGILGGDKAGFPNGRRLADDVHDIGLRVLAGASPLTPAFDKAPNNQLGDGVDANNKPFKSTFPYVAEPIAGYESTNGQKPNQG